MKTRVCELLHIQYPIIQGAVPVPHRARLAAAVSQAGGLGTTFSLVPPEELRRQIQEIRRLTQNPFSVNVPLLFGLERAREIVRVALEEGVKVFTTSAGNPDLLTPYLKDAGAMVMHVVPSVKHAQKAAAAGVDIVIASGVEAGGWQSYDEVTTLTLVPQVVDAISIPVVAAGGIADARGFMAALALGAEGIQMGTRFIASVEAGANEDWQNDILRAKDSSTEIVGRGQRPLRAFKVDFLQETRPGGEVARPTEPRGQAGQISGLIGEILTVQEIMDGIIQGAIAIHDKISLNLA